MYGVLVIWLGRHSSFDPPVLCKIFRGGKELRAPAKSTAGAANYKSEKGEREENNEIRGRAEIGVNLVVRWGVYGDYRNKK